MTDSQRPSQPSDGSADDAARQVPDHAAPDAAAPAPSDADTAAVTPSEPGPAEQATESPAPEDTSATEELSAGRHSAPDDTPTGEVVTGPIRYQPDPQTQAYSQSGKPPTRQMDALDSEAFAPIPSGPPMPPPTSPDAPIKSSPARKRGRGRTIGLIAAAVVLLIVIAGVGSELYIRHKVTNCLQTSFENLTGTGTDVSVSRKPMLLTMMDGDVPWVQVDTTGGGNDTMQLHARAEGISTDGGTVKSLDGNGFLPYERIKTMSSGENGSPAIESIPADPKAGTLKIETTVTVAILPVPATVTLKPVLKDGAVSFEVEDATALVFGLPKDFAQPIVDQVTNAMFGPLFKQIKVTKLDVGQTGIDFAFSGQDVNLKSAAESTNTSSTSSSSGCSV
ncbi:LmeA family phospholipid-binding protein [Gordonia neofelifaecis]|uniref:DUF2993 domain-containing protein n=1 Tax=Gordonia neofelifaecis NRRL B-59395 TaxID=644548 RepID=F1YLJ1_9ACTN|nr:LmeA family phospholipid-binding protein [Gordonia neofelifaecis]EGD54385.1 hypothetical protein SCNU_13914 [Gordonia neofelifaecis NRRL B-59395]